MSSKSVVELLEKIVTSTPNTCRTVFAIVLVIGVVIVGLWVLNANLTAGPISVIGRNTPQASTCAEDTAAAGGHCARG